MVVPYITNYKLSIKNNKCICDKTYKYYTSFKIEKNNYKLYCLENDESLKKHPLGLSFFPFFLTINRKIHY